MKKLLSEVKALESPVPAKKMKMNIFGSGAARNLGRTPPGTTAADVLKTPVVGKVTPKIVPKLAMARTMSRGGGEEPRTPKVEIDVNRMYNDMAVKISAKVLDAANVAEILRRCIEDTSVFKKAEGRLVDSILNCPWTVKDPENFDFVAYENCIFALLAAETYRLDQVLSALVSALLDETKEASENRIHSLIASVALHFKTAQEKVPHVLVKILPRLKRDSGTGLVRFTTQMLRISEYMPKISGKLWFYVINRLSAFDVRVPEEGVYALCNDLLECNPEEDEEKNELYVQTLREQANCLDRATEIVIQELLQRIRADPASDEQVMDQLLSSCGDLFLNCETTTHLQYVLFVLGAESIRCAQHLVTWLWNKIRNPRSKPSEREVAVGYMASFLSRANFLTVDEKRHCLETMCGFAAKYIQEGSHKTSMDFKAHLPFFALCQGIFYVVGFNHRQLTRKKSGLAHLQQLGLDKIAHCALNPLKYCQPDVVKNFANVARHHQITYCHSIIERNERNAVPELEWGPNGEVREMIRAYLSPIFPFDKPLMPRCRKLVQPHYAEYEETEPTPDPLPEAVISDAASPRHRERKTTTGSIGGEVFDYSESPGFVHW